jgi:predicted chitinase
MMPITPSGRRKMKFGNTNGRKLMIGVDWPGCEMSDFRTDLGRIFTSARARDLDELGPWIAATMSRYAIDSPLRQCHFLAQIGHESGELRYREEIASGAAYEGRRDLGNTQRGDGARFKGRGLIQLTGRANYARYDAARGLDGLLLREPGRVAFDFELCCDVAGWYWASRDLNRWAEQDDLVKVTRLINGGTNGLADRQRLLVRAKHVLMGLRSTLELQRALNRAGARPLLVEDGVFGPITRAALIAFQRAQGLAADGVAGPSTWARLSD